MELLMDIYFIDTDKHKDSKKIIEELSHADNTEIRDYAIVLLKDKLVNPIWYNFKKFIIDNTWILWTIIFLVIICFDKGFKEGFLSTGIILAGSLFGYLLAMTVNDLYRGRELKL
jgi:hypothetical protein